MATRLFHISDVHFGVEDRAALADLKRAIEIERPDALVCTGDLTQRATHKQYKAAAEWFGSIKVPIWLDPGNHDMPYYNLWERFTRPYHRFNRLRDAVAVSEFETEDLVLIPLKTTVRSQNRWPWSDGHVTANASSRTFESLRRYDGDPRHLIVTAHHPLHGPVSGGPSDTVRGNEVIASLAENGMDAIMTGHIHKPFSELRSGPDWSAHVIGAGTLSTRLRHAAPPSYNVLTCKAGEDIHVEARTLKGGRT